jgi:curli biogenesis system outer membrane secretion channel CsgG
MAGVQRCARALLILGATLSWGCATQMTVARTKPAEVNLRGVSRIAVYAVEGQDGPQLESSLTQALFDSKRFELVERSALDKIVKEHGMSLDAAFQSDGVELGQMLPAAAIVSGRVSAANYDERMERRDHTCRKTNDGKNYYEATCTSVRRIGKANYVADLRVLDTNTGRVLAVKSVRDEKTAETAATDEEPERIDGDSLVNAARASVVEQFLRVIAPYKVNERVTLVDDGDLPELEQGNKYLQRDDAASALDFYKKAVASSARPGISQEAQAKAHYSLGLGLALIGDYDASLKALQNANSMADESDWLDMEMRVKRWKKEAEAVEEQKRDAAGAGETASTGN